MTEPQPRAGTVAALILTTLVALAIGASGGVTGVPAERLYFEALRLIEEGNEKKALQLLLAVPMAPEVDLAHGSYTDIAHRRELIQLLINEGLSGLDPGFKIDKFGQALKARALTRAAEIYIRQRDYEAAIDAAQRAQLAEPDYPMAYCRAAEAYREKGDLAEAIKQANKAYLKSPTYVEYRRTYASVIARDAARLHQQGETGKARLAFEFALQIDPLNPETLCRYGWLLFCGKELPFELDDGEENNAAVRRYAQFNGLYMMLQAVRLAPEMAAYHLQLGQAYEALGQTEDAAGCYERAVELEPENLEALRGAARAAVRLQACESAIEHLTKAVRINPDDALTHALLAEAYRCAGVPKKAVQEARTAVRLDPEAPRAHYELGMALLQRGQRGQAREPLEAALSLDPNGEVGLRAKARLVQLDADPTG